MNSIILFNNSELMGSIPYKNYNCSIVKLNKEETLKITNGEYNQETILIIFFVSTPGKRFGSMSWIGLICQDILLKLLNNKDINESDNFWIIKPHLLQNDKGPKCADLRIFKIKNNIGIIGYSRLAPKSNTLNIADYYVRTSILNIKINNNLYKKSNKLYHFNEIDGGCFPSKIGNNYKKFKINNDRCKVNKIEFYIKDIYNSKLITPHKSKNKFMPNQIKLNGIEVSFSKNNSNEDFKTHISTKNIVPLQHINFLDNIGCFVDISPPNCKQPLITIQNIYNAEVYYTDTIIINEKFTCKKFRGSTPFIELKNNYWITLLHKRLKNNSFKYNIKYEYFFAFFTSKNININNNIISIPDKCESELKLEIIEKFKNDFIYITGLIVLEQNILDNFLILNLLISYGISDEKSGITKLKIKLPLKNVNIEKLKNL